MTRGPRRTIAPARLTTPVVTSEAARTTHGPRRVTAPARRTTVAGVLTAVAAVAATVEAARMRRDQRRAITLARRTTAGDTAQVLPLAALVLTMVAAAIKAAAAPIRAGAVVAQSQKICAADLTICALKRHQLDHVRPHRRVIGFQGALLQELFDIAPRQRVSKVPTNGTKNECGFGLPPFEDRWSGCHGSFQPTSPRGN
jgi:hypothetical protein